MLSIFRTIGVAAAVAVIAASPAGAITAKEKKATCEFGANDQKLTGAARQSFMAKCMANENRGAKKQQPKAKPPAQ